MRLLLDAHISAQHIGEALRADGHDVLAVIERADLDGASDEQVLSLAAAERRILVTHNVRHFAPLLLEWAEAGRSHAGCVLVARIDHSQFGIVLRGLRLLLEQRPEPDQWADLALWLSPASTGR